jgi:hypothetical protein
MRAGVIAAGSTSVSRNPVTGAFMGEAAWNNGGGGPSLYVICGPYAGYWAAPGWDFCVGVGSPTGMGIL